MTKYSLPMDQWQNRGDGEEAWGEDSINVEMNTVPSSSGEARARTKDWAQPKRNLSSLLGAFVAGVILALLGCVGVVWSSSSATTCRGAAASDDVLRPAVIVVTAMTSEMERWVERLPLGETLPFPPSP